MSEFEPTLEQQACIDAAKKTKDNLLINALAGAAKTTTLVMIANSIRHIPTLCLAFNKRIQLDLEKKMPVNCDTRTLNGLGHRAWGQFIGGRLILDDSKTYKILTKLVDELPSSNKEEAFELFADTLQAIRTGKTAGYVPDKTHEYAKGLMGDDEFFSCLDEAPTVLQEQLIRKASKESIFMGLANHIDYADQLLLPTVFPVRFQRYPLVLVDEAQDLSLLNHAMLDKVAKDRLIAVGDPCQSIYGFRGAHEDSMPKLETERNMKQLHLTISFRCPIAVVKEAHWRAPAMQYPDWAKEGSVRTLSEWTTRDLSNNAVILCRNNAPLFYMAIRLLVNGRYPELVGNDIGKFLIKVLKKLGPSELSQEEALQAVAEWGELKKSKSRNPEKLNDQIECLQIFVRQGKTLGDAIAYAEHIMSAAGPVKLMTGHKSKGLEFDDVYILDRHLINTKQTQDRNLLYVMQTRSKENLTYITTEGFK